MDRLPEEVLQSILEHVPSDPDPHRLCMRLAPSQWYYPPVPADRPVVRARKTPTYELLRVQKRWARILLRVLYTCVTLTQPRHASGVISRLRLEPHLGRRVRSLWLQAGTPAEWAEIVARTPNVSLLYLNVDALTKGTERQFRQVCDRLDPKTMWLHWMGKKANVHRVIMTYLSSGWTNLVDLHINDDFEFYQAIICSLPDTTNLRTIHVTHFGLGVDPFVVSTLREKGVNLVVRTRASSQSADMDMDTDVSRHEPVNGLHLARALQAGDTRVIETLRLSLSRSFLVFTKFRP